MEIFVAGLMVALTLVIVATRRHGKDTSILWASIQISISLLLNLNPVYVSADRLLGGRNYADLTANLLLLVGVYFLARAIHRAASPTSESGASPRVLGSAAVVVTVTVAAALFAFIDGPATSTAFMQEYGAQPAAALYSAVQYAYIGAVMATAGWTCLKFRKSWSTGVYKAAFALVGLGCASAVLLVVHVLLLDTLHIFGEQETMKSLSGLYAWLNSTTFALLCTGLALPPARRRILTVLDATRTKTVLAELMPVWRKAVVGNSGVTLDTRVVADRDHRPRRQLHRMIVEIQDSLVRDCRARERIGDEGLQKLAQAGAHLDGQAWR
ncbi:hypothetical protein [Paenarthrobacter aromaticivorans]|uniref:Histidine kinase N-terminal 7TM region domain-containing protein n=1 Tax=Paenarthrobacter aromaticivorans TaxID=2849150 RepID=A0ABS6I905_9MICC|nr:hypothetical protein [Paenarthrobacter sp. MMS21-TAE1-1]MBU8867872.1 hypothetical protein [Paenarthrobacter sp. MMS21-TAE1-1]